MWDHMEVQKSSRHSKITGNFVENLICIKYWINDFFFVII